MIARLEVICSELFRLGQMRSGESAALDHKRQDSGKRRPNRSILWAQIQVYTAMIKVLISFVQHP